MPTQPITALGAMFISFRSDGFAQRRGFRARYSRSDDGTMLADSDPPPSDNSAAVANRPCTGVRRLSTQSGVLSDGSLPYEHYRSNSFCGWQIVGGCSARLSIEFSYFQVETRYDWLKIYQGSSSAGRHYSYNRPLRAISAVHHPQVGCSRLSLTSTEVWCWTAARCMSSFSRTSPSAAVASLQSIAGPATHPHRAPPPTPT